MLSLHRFINDYWREKNSNFNNHKALQYSFHTSNAVDKVVYGNDVESVLEKFHATMGRDISKKQGKFKVSANNVKPKDFLVIRKLVRRMKSSKRTIVYSQILLLTLRHRWPKWSGLRSALNCWKFRSSTFRFRKAEKKYEYKLKGEFLALKDKCFFVVCRCKLVMIS